MFALVFKFFNNFFSVLVQFNKLYIFKSRFEFAVTLNDFNTCLLYTSDVYQRQVAEEVTFPLSDQEIILGEKMMQFLKHSQDPVMAEKMGLRGGVGLAAPQLDISKRIIAVLVPNIVEEGETPQEAYDLQAVMYNPKIVSHSVQDAALGEGEGCLSVDRNVPGYVCLLYTSHYSF